MTVSEHKRINMVVDVNCVRKLGILMNGGVEGEKELKNKKLWAGSSMVEHESYKFEESVQFTPSL